MDGENDASAISVEAGRSRSPLARRLLSAAILSPLTVVGVLYLPSVLLLAVLLGVSSLTLWEFYRMLDRANIPAFRYCGLGCGAFIMCATYFGLKWRALDGVAVNTAAGGAWESLAVMCTVLLLLVRQFPQKNNDKPLPTVACTLMGVMYVALLLNTFTKLGLFRGNVPWSSPMAGRPGAWLILYPIVLAKVTDGAAFFAGMAAGRRKLFPRLSPAKTWEGLAGGLVAGVIVSLVFARLSGGRLGGISIATPHAIVLGVFLPLAGMIGDLAESLIKRAALVKDSGDIIPGIGGLLDIMDSTLFVAPMFYLYLTLVLLP